MDQTSIVDVGYPEYQSILEYVYSDKETQIVSHIFQRFIVAQQNRDRAFQYLDGRTLVDYINDSVRRYTTNVDERDDIEDWQARVNDPFTRNKLTAILGKAVEALPIVDVYGRGAEDYVKSEILNTLLEYAEDRDDIEEFMIYALEEAIVKGTMIGYEGIVTRTRKVRDVVKYPKEDELTVKESENKERYLHSQIVPLEEFYPSSVGIRDLKDMPYCFWRKEMPFTQFVLEYGNLKKAQYVQPYSGAVTNRRGKLPFYKDYVSSTVREGNVEVIKFYDQDNDEYVIVANGIWLNPLEGEVVSPLPFNHKRLPFWVLRYDIFGSDFFYGKSLPDKIKSLQDVLNVLHNMLLDQSFLSIFPPILTAGIDDIEDDFLRPGRRIVVDTQGLPLDQAYMKLDIGTPQGWHQFILNYTKDILEESSVDKTQQGMAGVGGRTTATEIRSAAAGVVSFMILFAKFLKSATKQRGWLRVKNILQFYTDPKNPIIEGVLGSGGAKEFEKAFNIFTVDSDALTPGNRGTKMIALYDSLDDLPTKTELGVSAKLSELEANKKVTIHAITADYLRDADFDLRLIPNPKSDVSREADRALEIQFDQTMTALFGDIIDRTEMAAQLITKFGKDPRTILKQDVIAQAIQPPQNANAQAPNGQSMMPQPGGNNSANVVKGATGVGSAPPADLRYLIQGTPQQGNA